MINAGDAAQVVDRALSQSGEFAELFAEQRRSLILGLQNGAVETFRLSADTGVAVRVVRNDRVGFSYTEDLTEPALLAAGANAGAAAGCEANPVTALTRPVAVSVPSGTETGSFSVPDRMRLLLSITEAAWATASSIIRVRVEMVERVQRIRVVNSEGLAADDERTCLLVLVKTLAQKGGRTAPGQARLGLVDLKAPWAPEAAADVGRQAAEAALRGLDSRLPAPGAMPVVFGPGAGGVLIHEAVGHPSEGDFLARGESLFAARRGHVLAPPHISVWDDPTLPGLFGSFRCDDEGTPARPVCLIDRGRFVGCITDRLTARRLGVAPSGHGRREGYRYLPAPRMSNTYLGRGEYSLEEIIRRTDTGLYVGAVGAGRVDVATGEFSFRVTEGYRIEGGRLTAPVQDLTLSGNSLDLLNEIDLVGGELAFHPGQCGKLNQNLEITIGGPGYRVRAMGVAGAVEQGGSGV